MPKHKRKPEDSPEFRRELFGDPICELVHELNEAATALYDAKVAHDKAALHHVDMVQRVSTAQLALDAAVATRRKEASLDTRWGRGG